MQITLFDLPGTRANLMPFTYTRPVAALRCGILTIAEKWGHYLKKEPDWLTEPYLQSLFPLTGAGERLFINGALCPNPQLAEAVDGMADHAILYKEGLPIAWKSDLETASRILLNNIPKDFKTVDLDVDVVIIRHTWDLFLNNRAQIEADFNILTTQRTSSDITDPHTRLYGENQIFVEKGATICAAVINATRGPVYIGKDAIISENATIRGAFSLGEGALINVGAKLIGDSSIGPYCKAGGEISNSIMYEYSNKVHEGFLGNSIIGSWCNIGAGTNASNLKNNYGNVKVWDYTEKRLSSSNQMFCGLAMGDHSKCSIQTTFNTGTVVGVGANIFGHGFPPKFVPSFTWGFDEEYRFEDFLKTATVVLERKNKYLNDFERDALLHIYNSTSAFRNKK